MVFNSLRSNGWLHSPLQSCGSRPTTLLNILWRSTSFVPNATADVGHEIRITKPDDWHLHVREGKGLESVVPITAEQYSRAIIMPNLVPPVTTTDMAQAYKEKIKQAAGEKNFSPLMTLYLTDNTAPEEIYRAKEEGVVALKMYPAGATTNSDSGVTDWTKCKDTLRAMQEVDLPLLVHGEVTDPQVDFFDREAEFINRVLLPLLDSMPNLRVVMEHITTRDAVDFVTNAPENIAASITPQHILWNRNTLFNGGLRPHSFCLPILKRETHREAVAAAATSGNSKFFLGTDSAPHPKGAKESSCGCAGVFSAPVALCLYAHAFDMAGSLQNFEAFSSFNGPDFYQMKRNTEQITLRKSSWRVPDSYSFGDTTVVPMWAGLECPWEIVLD